MTVTWMSKGWYHSAFELRMKISEDTWIFNVSEVRRSRDFLKVETPLKMKSLMLPEVFGEWAHLVSSNDGGLVLLGQMVPATV